MKLEDLVAINIKYSLFKFLYSVDRGGEFIRIIINDPHYSYNFSSLEDLHRMLINWTVSEEERIELWNIYKDSLNKPASEIKSELSLIMLSI
jgi:hypothetical protein